MDIWTIVLSGIGGLFAIVIGMFMAKISSWFQGKMIARRALKFAEGKIENNITLDGEKINVTKFKWKDYDGKDRYWEITPNKESPKIPQIQEQKKPDYKRLSDYAED